MVNGFGRAKVRNFFHPAGSFTGNSPIFVWPERLPVDFNSTNPFSCHNFAARTSK